MKMTTKKTFGDFTKLNENEYTQRGRVAATREDPPETYIPPKKLKVLKK